MATILTKKKDTSGAPSAGDLTNSTGGAELAVNTADKRLYTKDSGGNVVEVGTNPSTINIDAGSIDGTPIGANSASTGSFTTLNTSGAVVFNDAGADVDFRVEGDTDANLLFVDAGNDRVGIGTSSPSGKLNLSDSTSCQLNINSAAAGFTREILFSTGTNTQEGKISCDNAAGELRFESGRSGTSSYIQTFYTNNTERMRITSAGYLKASNSGSYRSTIGNYHEFNQTDDSANLVINSTNASLTNEMLFLGATRNTTNNTFYAIRYYNDGAGAYKFQVADSGNVTNTNNSYGSISDVKLKQDIVDAGSQWNDIKNLRVRKYRWKSDPDGFMQMGLVAQEAELVSPGLIDEHPDFEEVEVPVLDDEGNPVLNEDGTPQVTKERNALGTTTKAVKYSVLYMKAVKALQEAMERIETLEAKVAALENA